MVGGIVIEVCEVKHLKDALYIDCRSREYNNTCAIYVEKNFISEKIEIGDTIWWQHKYAYWTPQNSKRLLCGHDYDIKIQKIGYSGVEHP